jgi:hypothetical protein
MGVFLRPLQIGRRAGTAYLFSAAAFLLGASLVLPGWAAIGDPDSTASIQPPTLTAEAPQRVSIRAAAEGRESIRLSARLSPQSQGPADGVVWQVSTLQGDVVADGTANELDFLVAPGEYMVRAKLGFKEITEPLTLPKKSSLNVTYLLNAGALRVLPRLTGTLSGDVESVSKIFAIDGTLRGQLITTSNMPGEVMMLAAGRYRIESLFTAGNARAVMDVAVKAGIMSAVDIDHAVGFVTLKSSEARDYSVWQVKSAKGDIVAKANGSLPALVLQPGIYTASMSTALARREATFEVKVGQGQDISLDP